MLKASRAALDTVGAVLARWMKGGHRWRNTNLHRHLAHALDEAKFLAEAAAARERVQKWVEVEPLLAWLDARDRAPATSAFSEGNERQIAYRFEQAEENFWTDVAEVAGEMAWGVNTPSLPPLTPEQVRLLCEALRVRAKAHGGWLQRERRRVLELEAAIVRHRAQTGQDLCWENDEALWKVLDDGVVIDHTPPPWPEFMAGCVAYRASRERNHSDTPE